MKEHLRDNSARRAVQRGMRRATVAAAIAAAACGSARAPAQEVIVQNESIEVNSSPFFILADFAPGDQGGARLTVPCDGRIVGVQVGWWGTWFAGYETIEEAIHIFEDGTFPDPGAELGTIVNPRLGFLPSLQPSINEFRSFDEDGSMPIEIPVVQGEAIVVTLEFANPTTVQSGTPNLVMDDDGCTEMGNLLFSNSAQMWIDGCDFLPGDILVRLIVDCDEPGACCLPDGTCSEMLINDCTALGGSFQGEGTTCAGTSCPQPSGACCITSTQGCIFVTEADCNTAAGIWQGFGTDCNTFDCFPLGACCLTDSGDCITATEIDCGGVGGVWQGAGVLCGDVGCPQPCPSDGDGSGEVDVTDLLVLLSKWGPCPPPCAPDIDGDGNVDVTDLLILLADWGPCT